MKNPGLAGYGATADVLLGAATAACLGLPLGASKGLGMALGPVEAAAAGDAAAAPCRARRALELALLGRVAGLWEVIRPLLLRARVVAVVVVAC